VLAAGAVVWRPGSEDIEILVVHRPSHGDWTLPKGKQDPGERLPVTAVREVLEETSIPVRLGLPLAEVDYPVTKPAPMTKRVSYWAARPIGSGDLAHEANAEVDEVRWVDVSEVSRLLTYDRDRDLVDRLEKLRTTSWHKTRPLVVLRHGHARPRARWDGDDRLRPLSDQGMREAHQLVPLLAAYGVTRVVSSDSARCVSTVEPYARHLGVEVEAAPELTEQQADPRTVDERLTALVAAKEAVVVCTHRPVLPLALAAIGVQPHRLEPGEMVVAHRRRGRVVGTERHRP